MADLTSVTPLTDDTTGVHLPAHAPGLLDWALLARSVSAFHGSPDAGSAALNEALVEVQVPTAERLADLNAHDARLAALDVLMVEAFCRCREIPLLPDAHARLGAAATAVAARLDVPPILSYPLYIRANPPSLESIRRFTLTDEEFRFIRMHRLIEDQFDEMIAQLSGALASDDMDSAIVEATADLLAGFRLVNRTIAAFRSPTRMNREVFVDGFRPYFASATYDDVTYEGPSGLQSPTFRIMAALMGYRDDVLDGHTRAIAVYHEPATRAALAASIERRDGGHSLSGFDDLRQSGTPLPHLHPDYGRHAPALLQMALADQAVSPDIATELRAAGVDLGVWPASIPKPAQLPNPPNSSPSTHVGEHSPGAPGVREALSAAARLEAAFFGFHLEHVATTAYQIGYRTGTGGTSGVEFLLLATFRRSLPQFWQAS